MQEQTGIDFWRYVGILKRWLWLLILATVLGAGAAYGFSRTQTPVYQAQTTLYINQAPGALTTSSSTDYNSLLTSKSLASTYAQLLTERKVLESVIPLLPVTKTVEQLKGELSVSVVRDTQLIQVTVEDEDPKLAAQIANTLSSQFIDQIQQMQSDRYKANKDSLSTQIADIDKQIQDTQNQITALGNSDADQTKRDRLEAILSQYRQSYANLLQTYEQIRFAEAQTSSNVTQVEAAIAPTSPIRPKIPTNTLLGGVVGLLVALGVVFLVESLDDTLKHVSQIIGTGADTLPVLGFIPFFETAEDRVPLVASQPRSPVAERFRALRTNIQFTSVDHPLHTILVTSPAPGDGKTTVATNLAVAMAQSGRQVALVDTDLRRPTLHKKLNVANGAGISAMFVQPRVHLNGNLQSTGLPGLDVLPGGSTPPNPAELLGSAKMQEVLHAVQEQRELLILDSPPVTSVTDAVVLSPRVDGVVLVVRPGQTNVGACRAAIDELRRAGANILGIVLNGVKADDARYYSGQYHYYYYHYYYQDDKPLTGFAKFEANLKRRLGIKPQHRHHRRSKSAAGPNGVNVDAWLEPESAKQDSQKEGEH
jgi:succinoglycan biosynthesis transport protein ExoP